MSDHTIGTANNGADANNVINNNANNNNVNNNAANNNNANNNNVANNNSNANNNVNNNAANNNNNAANNANNNNNNNANDNNNAANDNNSTEPIYLVVRNAEEQYSIWPEGREVPAGWETDGTVGPKDACLEHITQVWTDMRPLSLRRRMDLSRV